VVLILGSKNQVSRSKKHLNTERHIVDLNHATDALKSKTTEVCATNKKATVCRARLTTGKPGKCPGASRFWGPRF